MAYLSYIGLERRWVNYYDGSKPDTRLELEGEFTMEKYKEWL